ncbi:hypothetical protein KKF81_01130 [Candidatus Micrarchaeota archaeon]|nr:hypothetical protein [Candidatus Micrarchaeota archaeon]MBU1165523.1 hypothetical protein [Candidatus Micrarchaeota archaeon]MBU1887421.1 hypothetical protein [Candidatus Micrarchaeota archaeon]
MKLKYKTSLGPDAGMHGRSNPTTGSTFKTSLAKPLNGHDTLSAGSKHSLNGHYGCFSLPSKVAPNDRIVWVSDTNPTRQTSDGLPEPKSGSHVLNVILVSPSCLNEFAISTSLNTCHREPPDLIIETLDGLSKLFGMIGGLTAALSGALYIAEYVFVSCNPEGDYYMPPITNILNPPTLLAIASLECFSTAGIFLTALKSYDIASWFGSAKDKINSFGRSLDNLTDRCIDILAYPVKSIKGLEAYLDVWGENVLQDTKSILSAFRIKLSAGKIKSGKPIEQIRFTYDFAGYTSAELEQEVQPMPKKRLIDRVLHSVSSALVNTIGKIPSSVVASIGGTLSALIFIAPWYLSGWDEFVVNHSISHKIYYGCGVVMSFATTLLIIPLFINLYYTSKDWFDPLASKIDNRTKSIRAKFDV